MKILNVLLISLFLILGACWQDSKKSSGSGAGGEQGKMGGNCSAQPLLAANVTGGCQIRMVTPANCEVIDLSNGKTYEFAWTTDGTTCETPFTIVLAGNPPEEGKNVFEITINTNGSTITTKGGIINASANDFAEVPTTDGTYHWVVKGYYGSHPASQQFGVKK